MTQLGVGGKRWAPVHWILAALALGGTILILVATRRFGAGLTADSGEYLACARNVMASIGYRRMDGGPFTFWPPLFPSLLALLGWLGVDPPEGARWLNAVVFGLTVFTSGHVFLLTLRSRALAVLGALTTFGFALVQNASIVWSESLFILLVLWFLLTLSELIEQPSRRGWLWLALLGALACLQRYLGISLVLAGGLSLLLAPRVAPWPRRLWWAASFGAASLIPVAAWMVRNRLVVGAWAGPRVPSSTSLAAQLELLYVTLSGWFSPVVAPVLAGCAILAMAAIPTLLVVRFIGRRGSRSSDSATQAEGDRSLTPVAVMIGFAWCYSALLLGMMLVVGNTPVDDRYLSPIYVPTMAVLFIPVDRFLGWTRKRLARQPARRAWWVQAAIITLVGLALVLPLRRTLVYAAVGVKSGIGVYERSPVMAWLRDHEPSGVLYANDPMPPCLLLRRSVRRVPGTGDSVSTFLRGLSPETDNYLLWYNRSPRRPRSVLDAFVASGRATLVQETSDGSVYRLD